MERFRRINTANAKTAAAPNVPGSGASAPFVLTTNVAVPAE
jgi:hypothetical protein